MSATVPAEMLRGKRVTLRGEIETRNAGGASLWMRVDRSAEMSMLDNGQDRAVKGDSKWTLFAVMLRCRLRRSSLAIGINRQGAASVSARSVRFEAGPALRADGPIVPDAKAVVEAVIDLVQKNAWMRGNNRPWTVVETEVRLLAAGVDKSAGTYPAIRYLLVSLNDRHSFLMRTCCHRLPSVLVVMPIYRSTSTERLLIGSATSTCRPTAAGRRPPPGISPETLTSSLQRSSDRNLLWLDCRSP